jgi:hypothetical protein
LGLQKESCGPASLTEHQDCWLHFALYTPILFLQEATLPAHLPWLGQMHSMRQV